MNAMTKQQTPQRGFYNGNSDIKLTKTTLEVKTLIKINWIYARFVYCLFLTKRNCKGEISSIYNSVKFNGFSGLNCQCKLYENLQRNQYI